MKRRRRNKNGTKFYMGMSILCLTVLFLGYSYVYSLSEKRKSGQDITTISISYNGDEEKENKEDNMNAIDKIMSYFNIFLEKTFKESEDTSRLKENGGQKTEDVFKDMDGKEKTEPEEDKEPEIYEEDNDSHIADKKVYLADNRQENFFRVIESPTYRSSAPRNTNFDAASVNEKLNIVLFDTHGTEAYLPHEEGNFRTQDERYNVMGLGGKIAANLQGYGLNASHLKDYNDYPDYNSSYANSSHAVKQVLSDSKKNLVIDVHRDGAEENSNYEHMLSKVKTVKINDKTAATCTLVIGDKNGNYEELKKNAQLLYEKAQEMYPGLFRDIIVRPGAYFNQYLSDYALLIEIGSTLNNVDEVNYSAELLSEILVEYIREISK